MDAYTVKDAQHCLDELLTQAQRGPVSITQQGRPAGILTSDEDYQQLLSLKRDMLTGAVATGFEQLDAGETSSRKVEDIASDVLQSCKRG